MLLKALFVVPRIGCAVFLSHIILCIVLLIRGRANLKASLDDLLSNGMDKATDVILTGCSGKLYLLL